MRSLFLAVAILFAVACGDSEPWDGEVVSLSAYSILKPGATPPPACAEAGRLFVPARKVSVLARFSGSAVEEFSETLSRQVKEVGANLLVPAGKVGLVAAAESGEEFTATAYRCPT